MMHQDDRERELYAIFATLRSRTEWAAPSFDEIVSRERRFRVRLRSRRLPKALAAAAAVILLAISLSFLRQDSGAPPSLPPSAFESWRSPTESLLAFGMESSSCGEHLRRGGVGSSLRGGALSTWRSPTGGLGLPASSGGRSKPPAERGTG